MKTLYLCYFGVREPLVQTQVIPYLRAIARSGVGTHLLTFEPAGPRGCHRPEEQRAVRAQLEVDGIGWHRLRYHRRPSLPATAFDMAVGTVRAAWLARRHGIDVVHARSHVPATMALILKRVFGLKFLFDLRGLIADEYADTGHWSRESLPFRLTKRAERTLLREADAVVTLTAQIQEILFPEGGAGASAECGVRGAECPTPDAQPSSLLRTPHAARRTPHSRRPLAVIPCCVDLARFHAARADRERRRQELGLGSGTVIAYLGGLGGCYLTGELAAFTAAAREVAPDTQLLALSQGHHDLLRHELERRGVPASAYHIQYVEPERVPSYLGAADIALSLIQPGFSKIACSPTKIAEYLAAGLPIASNAGIGDIDRVLLSANVGVVLESMAPETYRRAFARLRAELAEDPGIIERCRRTAREWFDLDAVGGPAYVRLYEELGRA